MTEPRPQPDPADLFPTAARRDLDALTMRQVDALARLSPDADVLRAVVGMERKAHLEMRVALGETHERLPIRRTAPLAEMSTAELARELPLTRRDTLALLDALLDGGAQGDVVVWSAGRLVPPVRYAEALLDRLIRLDTRLRGPQGTDVPTP